MSVIRSSVYPFVSSKVRARVKEYFPSQSILSGSYLKIGTLKNDGYVLTNRSIEISRICVRF